jgi:hypothetical protein
VNSLTSDGDVNGTPADVGLRMKPPQYLKGDVYELGLKGLATAVGYVSWRAQSRNSLCNASKIDPTGASYEESIDSSLYLVREV